MQLMLYYLVQLLTTWGEDDSVILEAIAAEQGTSVINVVSGSSNNMYF
jgi:hypothetical protein